MPEKATSAQGGLPLSAVLELLRAARTGRHPKFWLSPRALVPRAPPLMTDSFLSALVARNRWLLARPAARATGLAPPAGLRSSRAGLARPVARATGLAPRWSRSSRADLAVCACRTTQSPGGSSVGLALRWSPPLTPSVTAQSPARANSTGIRLLSTVPHWWLLQF